ncbi:MAG: hypothetical protein HYT80_07330 [Euryarchaeota archaeon]|nr:hypothetical protein [Euryarchaeota archaeon]
MSPDDAGAGAPIPEPTEAAGLVAKAASTASTVQKAANVAAAALRHKELIVAAMETLREHSFLSEEEEVKLLNTWEQGSATAKSLVQDMLERLQQSNFGKIIVNLKEQTKLEDITPAGVRGAAQPYIAAAKEEAKPYIERAKQRLLELKALEEPTIKRLEVVSANLKEASKEVVTGLRGVGKEAVDEVFRRGRTWWMSAETEELEREFFDFVLRTLPKAERGLVQVLQFAQYAAIFLLLFLGIMLLNWGIKFAENMKTGRSEVERLARMTPAQRRIHLAQRWTMRAQEEGMMDPEEAKEVLQETIRAAPPNERVDVEPPPPATP